MRLAHELAQNNVVVVYFSVMLPQQLLANRDVLSHFDSVHFLSTECHSPVRCANRRTSAVQVRFLRRTGVGFKSTHWLV